MLLLTSLAFWFLSSVVQADVGPAEDGPTAVEGLRWQLNDGQPLRYYVDSEVYLPLYMWFMASNNEEVRVTSFRVRAVLECTPSFAAKRSTAFVCDIEDAGLVASALPGDAGLLGPVLREMGDKLTGARLELSLREDGRLRDIDLREVDSRNRRRNAIRENLRLVLLRALAGLDLQLPRKGVAPDGVWAQYDSQILRSPSVNGTSGSAELVHRVEELDDGVALIHTSGEVTLVPGVGGGTTGYRTVRGDVLPNYFQGTVSGDALFDTGSGRLLLRTWAVETMPTASSWLAEGSLGLPYSQWGQLIALEPGQMLPVGESAEIDPPNLAPTVSRQHAYQGRR